MKSLILERMNYYQIDRQELPEHRINRQSRDRINTDGFRDYLEKEIHELVKGSHLADFVGLYTIDVTPKVKAIKEANISVPGVKTESREHITIKLK